MLEEQWPGVATRFANDRWTLQLRGGHEFRRQFKVFKQMVGGDAKLGELLFYPMLGNAGDHRSGSTGRKTSGGQPYFEKLLCRMAVWLPRDKSAAREGILHVKTGREALLVALNEKDECLWTYNADHVRRIIMARKRQLRRLAQDANADGRSRKRDGAAFTAHSELLKRKYRRRVNSLCHQVAASLADYAARRRFAKVLYNDGDHGYCQEFPWYELKARITEKLDARGIAFSDTTETPAHCLDSPLGTRAAA
jgi:hypothetical protein